MKKENGKSNNTILNIGTCDFLNENGGEVYRIVIEWADEQWKENYLEIAYYPNIIYFDSEEIIPLIRIIKKQDPINFILLYLHSENEAISFICRMVLKYGVESFIINEKENS